MARLTSTPAEIQHYLALLAATPQRIATCTGGVTDDRLHAAPAPKEWSVAEILAHLRGCEDVWSFSIYAMLLEDDLTLPILHPRKWTKIMRYAELDFRRSLQAFSLKREELLTVLRNLPEKAWDRTAIIGRNAHSVFSQARRMALHEDEHCTQIETILKAPDMKKE